MNGRGLSNCETTELEPGHKLGAKELKAYVTNWKKADEIPKGVTVKIEDGMVAVQGPKGKLDTALPAGIRVEQKDGHLLAIRENDSQSAVHGLARALVNNAVEGVAEACGTWKSLASAIAPR